VVARFVLDDGDGDSDPIQDEETLSV